MKTNREKPVVGQIEDKFDDIIFEYRNKNYGAYELRKKYNKRLIIAFFIAFILFSAGVLIPLAYII